MENANPPPNDEGTLSRRFEEVRESGCPDRGTKLQCLCEIYWNIIDHNPSLARKHIESFAQLLEKDSDLLLARLVIPDLRQNATPLQDPLKQDILHRIRAHRPSLYYLEPSRNKYAQAIPQYTEEKRIFQDLDMYRASLLLFNRGNLDETQEQAVRQWLEDCPIE
jgi:hypothetical protein